MKSIKKILLLTLLAVASGAYAQRFGIGTNTLYWATATPNASFHMRINQSLSLTVEATGRPHVFGIGGYDPKFISLAPEMRYWFLKHGMHRHFAGVMVEGVTYSIYHKTDTHAGDLLGVGATYGYDWLLGKHWNLETTIGLGCALYRDRNHGAPTNVAIRPMPLRLGVNFIYFIR